MTETSPTVSTDCSPLTTNSKPLSTTVHSVTANVSTEVESVSSDNLTTLELVKKHSGQEHEVQASPEESVMDCPVTVTAEIVGDVGEDTEETKTTESNEQCGSSKESENKTEEPTVVSGEVTVQNNDVKPKEKTVKLNDLAEAELEASKGTSDELCGDDVMNGDQKQHEIKSCDEK